MPRMELVSTLILTVLIPVLEVTQEETISSIGDILTLDVSMVGGDVREELTLFLVKIFSNVNVNSVGLEDLVTNVPSFLPEILIWFTGVFETGIDMQSLRDPLVRCLWRNSQEKTLITPTMTIT